jgi:hypothetical protein
VPPLPGGGRLLLVEEDNLEVGKARVTWEGRAAKLLTRRDITEFEAAQDGSPGP